MGIFDKFIDEPLGGANREPIQIISQVKSYLKDTIVELNQFTELELIQKRRDKFLEIGQNL